MAARVPAGSCMRAGGRVRMASESSAFVSVFECVRFHFRVRSFLFSKAFVFFVGRACWELRLCLSGGGRVVCWQWGREAHGAKFGNFIVMACVLVQKVRLQCSSGGAQMFQQGGGKEKMPPGLR